MNQTAKNPKSKQKTFVVVGAGQVGSQLVEQLAARGDAVVVVSRTPHALPAGASHRAVDLTAGTAANDLEAVFAGASGVFLAVNAPYSAKTWAATLPVMQQAVVTACERAKVPLVVLENLYVHGPRAEPLREDMAFTNTSKKGAVRRALTEALFARSTKNGGSLQVASVRPPDFWGPNLTAAMLDQKGVDALVNDGKAPNVIGDVDASHARASVSDVAAAMIAIADSDDADVWGRAWHPPVIHVSTRALVSAVAKAAGVKDPGVRALPAFALTALGLVVPFLKEMKEMLYQWDRPYLVDDSAFRARFGLTATSLEDGARACVAAAKKAPTTAPTKKAA